MALASQRHRNDDNSPPRIHRIQGKGDIVLSKDLRDIIALFHEKTGDISSKLKGLFGGTTIIEAIQGSDIGGALPTHSFPVKKKDDLGDIIELMNSKRGKEA